MSSVDLAHSATASHHGIIDKFGCFIDSLLNKIKPCFVKKNEGRAQGDKKPTMRETNSSEIKITKFETADLTSTNLNYLKENRNLLNKYESNLNSRIRELKLKEFKTRFIPIMHRISELSSKASDCFYEGYVRGRSKFMAHSSPLEKLKGDIEGYSVNLEKDINNLKKDYKNKINEIIIKLKTNESHKLDQVDTKDDLYKIAKAKESISTSIEKIDELNKLKIKINILNRIKNSFSKNKVSEQYIFKGMKDDEKIFGKYFLEKLGFNLNKKINQDELAKAMEKLESLERIVSISEKSAITSIENAFKDKLKCPPLIKNETINKTNSTKTERTENNANELENIKALPVKVTIGEIEGEGIEDKDKIKNIYSTLQNSKISEVHESLDFINIDSSSHNKIKVSYTSEGENKTMEIEFKNAEKVGSYFKQLEDDITDQNSKDKIKELLNDLQKEYPFQKPW